MMDVELDWAGNLPEPVLLEVAISHLSFPDIKSTALVCQRWSSVLQPLRRKVALLPVAPRGPRLTPAERYPPHLFCRRDTICLLPLSQQLVAATDAADLDTFACVLADYRLPLLYVRHALNPSLARRTRDEAARSAAEARLRRAQRDRAAAAAGWPRASAAATAAAGPVPPHPLQPYYDLSAPLVNTLTSLLRSPRQPGTHLRRLVLCLPCLPQPGALAALALLPSLQCLQLLGGPAAVLERGHLDALGALRSLTELALEGDWSELRRPGAAGGGGGGPLGPQQGIDDVLPQLDPAHHAGLPGGPGAGGDGDGDGSWPDMFNSLERLCVLRLRDHDDDGGDGRRPAVRQQVRPLPLDLHPLTALQSLSMRGRRLEPRLLPMVSLQGLTRLETDRVLSLAEWEAVRQMGDLATAALRAEVAGQVQPHVTIANSVLVPYGGLGHPHARGGYATVSFPFPPELRKDRAGLSDGGAGAAAAAGAAAEAPAAPLVGNMFAAAATRELSEAAWDAMVQQRLSQLGQLHVQLEPLRLLRENTSLVRLGLRWPSAASAPFFADPWAVDQLPFANEGGGGDGGAAAAHHPFLAPRGSASGAWRVDDALLVRRSYVPYLKSLSELQDVELRCPGGELVLDAGLLEALAPCWRGLTRLVYTGVTTGDNIDSALRLFPMLQELGLHDRPLPSDTATPASAAAAAAGPAAAAAAAGPAAAVNQRRQQQQQQPPPPPPPRTAKLVLRTDRLPAGLQRLSLSHVAVLHSPGAGLRRLKRLELRAGCIWQAGTPGRPLGPAAPQAAAGPSAAAAASPRAPLAAAPPPTSPRPSSRGPGAAVASVPGLWELSGMPHLTHLRLASVVLGPGGPRGVVSSCGALLRSLHLCMPTPSNWAEVAAHLADLSVVVPSLPRLAQLTVVMREPPAAAASALAYYRQQHQLQVQQQQGNQQQPQPHQAAAVAAAGAVLGGGNAGGAQGASQGGAAPARSGDVDNDVFRTLLLPVRRLVEALGGSARPGRAVGSAAAAVSPAGGRRRLEHLRELSLTLPSCGVSGILAGRGNQQPQPQPQPQQPPQQQQQQPQPQLQQLVTAALLSSLAGLGQLAQLWELRLYGPLVLAAAEPLERWLREALPYCHTQLGGAAS